MKFKLDDHDAVNDNNNSDDDDKLVTNTVALPLLVKST